MILWWLFYLVWSVSAKQAIIEGPQETFVAIGKSVLLKCRVEKQRGSVQWMKNGFGLGADRSLKFFPRYSMVGSVSRGEYNLQILNVTVSDDDVYACQISEALNEAAVVSNPAKLTVLMRPSAPQLHNGKRLITAIAGEPVLQSCVSRKGKPPPRLGWVIASDAEGRLIETWLGETRAKFGHTYKNSGVAKESYSADITEDVQKEDSVFSISSNISFSPRPEDDGKYLLCLSQHETFPEKVEVYGIKLSLRFAPVVSLEVASPSRKHHLREGESALLACNVNAKPLDNIQIEWYKNGIQRLLQSADTLTFEKLKMEDHGSEYSCQATNVIGTNRASMKLDVAFAPRIMSTSQDKEVNEGESSTFRCEATGNPLPSVFWTKAGDDQIIAKGEQLVLQNLRVWQQGEYICTASVAGFQHAFVSHFLHIRGAPVVTLEKQMTVAVGTNVDLSCHIHGRPLPPAIKWTMNGEEINYATGRVQVHQIPGTHGIESRLTINNVQEADFASYNCTAYNGFGRDGKGLLLRQQTLLDLLAPARWNLNVLLSIITAVILFVFFIVFCLICKRRGYSNTKGLTFLDDHSDVTVKCEPLDGQYFPEMYSSPLDNENLITSKDYISIPQNNPDHDFNVSSPFSGALYSKYFDNSTADYNSLGPQYDHTHGSFVSGVSTPGFSETYPASNEKISVLDTVTEVDTPKNSCYNFVSGFEPRSQSRTSTHV